MAVKKRKRIQTRLYEALDQLDVLLADSAKRPSALKAVVSKAEILRDLLQREDDAKARKAEPKVEPSAPAIPAVEGADDLIAQVAALKTEREKHGTN